MKQITLFFAVQVLDIYPRTLTNVCLVKENGIWLGKEKLPIDWNCGLGLGRQNIVIKVHSRSTKKVFFKISQNL